MISRKSKELFYSVLGPVMKLNGFFYKTFRAPSQNNNSVVKVHLGPGQEKYIEGWINVDANIFSGKADLWADLRNPLPFADNSVDVFYSHHVIEHLPNLEKHLSELYRCLKPNGKIRIGVPHGGNAIKKYMENDHDWFIKFPDERRSIGGKLENFLFCRQEHLTIMTYSFLEELLTDAKFKNIKEGRPLKSDRYPDLIDSKSISKEWEGDPLCSITLIVEAEK